jgi:outer membrane protein TolC
MTKESIFLILLLACAVRSIAQEAILLNLDTAVARSLEHSMALKISCTRVEVAQAKHTQLNATQLPSVRLSSGYSRISDNIIPFAARFPGNPSETILNPQILNQYKNTLSLTQLIYSGGRTKRTLQSLRELADASKMDLERDNFEVIFNTINGYYTLYKTEQSVKNIDESIVQVKGHLKEMQDLVGQGLALPNDVLRLELQLSNFELARIDAVNGRAIALFNLNVMLGFDTKTIIMVDTTGMIGADKNLKSLDEYLSIGLNNRNDIKASANRLRASEFSYQSTRSNYFHTLSFSGNYFYSRPNERVFPQQDAFKDTWALGLTLGWDISGLLTNKNFVREARANVAQNMAVKGQTEEAAKMEINSNYLACVKSKQKVKVSEKAVAQAQENFRILDNRFKNKAALTSDLIDANVLLLQSKLNLSVDKADAELAYYRLLKSLNIKPD